MDVCVLREEGESGRRLEEPQVKIMGWKALSQR